MDQASLAGCPVRYCHICALRNGRTDALASLDLFQLEGLKQQERVLRIGDTVCLDAQRQRFAALGVDVDAQERSGALQLRSWLDVYLDSQGRFDGPRILDEVKGFFEGAQTPGFRRLRAVADMRWMSARPDLAPAVLRYEAEVDKLLVERQQLAVCVYDMEDIDGAMLIRVLESHPLVFLEGKLLDSPFYSNGHEH